MKKESLQQRLQNITMQELELLHEPEYESIDVGGFTFSGPAASGKSTLTRMFIEELGIRRYTNAGQLFREETKRRTGKNVIGFYDRNKHYSLDKTIDTIQKAIIRTADVANPLVLEGRLSGIIAKRERDNVAKRGGYLPVITILVTASEEIRVKRAYERDKKLNPLLTLSEVRKLLKERDEKDIELWHRLYPYLKDVNPLNLSNRDIDGHRIHDYVIHTSYKTPKEGVSELLEKLEKDEHIRRRKEIKHHSFPYNGTVFPNSY